MNFLLNRLVNVWYPYWDKRLTVLAYHRIIKDTDDASGAAKIAVSATVSDFEKQMDFVKRHFNPITIDMLDQWLQGVLPELPSRPLLITFDDGYEDAYSNAMPVLHEQKIPAVIFLATGFIESKQIFPWDRVELCFKKTQLTEAVLPILGKREWLAAKDRNSVSKEWVIAAKQLADDLRQQATEQLLTVLNVSETNLSKIDVLSWLQIREMLNCGISFGGHTCNHPILSKVPIALAKKEVTDSKIKIEQEIAKPVFCFAYPNGHAEDFNNDVVSELNNAGYRQAFTLVPGPQTLDSVKNTPFEIRRVTVTPKDNLFRFFLKLSGFVQLKRLVLR